MDKISRIGMDTSKHIFQLHGVDEAERVVLRRKLRRKEVLPFFARLGPTVVALEACGGSHHWARELERLGHAVRLIAPQLAKPYVKRGKNDAADAEALCEASSRPTMRFVPVKTAEQQAALMLVGVRDRLIRNRTQLANAIRSYAAEFGLTAAKGKAHLGLLLERTQGDESLPALARELFAVINRSMTREIPHSPVALYEVAHLFWSSRCGNHLGQRSCVSAQTGRTYGRKRSDQTTAKHLARRGPSTYGECRMKRP